MHGTYIGNGRMLVQPQSGGRLIVSADDLSIMPDLVLLGVYDVPFTNFLRRTLAPGFKCIDVGANVGLFTVLMGTLVGSTGSVIAYEPSALVREYLVDNISMNYLGDWVKVADRAAYSTRTTLTFHAPRRSQMMGSLLEPSALEHQRLPQEIWDSYEVEAEPLDDVIGDGHFELVKIDVEGAEPQVFAGIERSMAEGRIDVIAFEHRRDLIRDQYDAFSDRLRHFGDAGWRYFTIRPEGELVPIGVEEIIERGEFAQVAMARPQ